MRFNALRLFTLHSFSEQARSHSGYSGLHFAGECPLRHEHGFGRRHHQGLQALQSRTVSHCQELSVWLPVLWQAVELSGQAVGLYSHHHLQQGAHLDPEAGDRQAASASTSIDLSSYGPRPRFSQGPCPGLLAKVPRQAGRRASKGPGCLGHKKS